MISVVQVQQSNNLFGNKDGGNNPKKEKKRKERKAKKKKKTCTIVKNKSKREKFTNWLVGCFLKSWETYPMFSFLLLNAFCSWFDWTEKKSTKSTNYPTISIPRVLRGWWIIQRRQKYSVTRRRNGGGIEKNRVWKIGTGMLYLKFNISKSSKKSQQKATYNSIDLKIMICRCFPKNQQNIWFVQPNRDPYGTFQSRTNSE